MFRRLIKDMNDIIKNGDTIYIKSSIDDRYKMYHTLLSLQNKIPRDIIQDIIQSFLFEIVTLENMRNDNNILKNRCVFKKKINNRNWSFQFLFCSEFPFKPPKVLMNGLGVCYIKNIEFRNGEDYAAVKCLLQKYSTFANQWTPALRINDCINNLTDAIEIHDNVSKRRRKKTKFLAMIDSSMKHNDLN